MKVTNTAKQTPYRRNSYRENSKSNYYNNREEQKPSYNFIQQTKIRIVQDNLVSVSGLPTQYDDPNLLSDNQHFGKYGTVDKIIISSQGKHKTAFIQVYITYEKSCDAAFAIRALDGIKIKGRELTATFGTTKYCTYFLKQNECRNEKCFYLHAYDTKNQLMDGVKNNMDFLDQKSQKIVNLNLKYYIQKEQQQKQQKIVSQFPTIGETIQYLIQQQLIDGVYAQKLRKQVIQQRKKKQELKKNQKHTDGNEENQQNQQEGINQNQNVSSIQETITNSNKSNDKRNKKEKQEQEDMQQLTQIVNELQLNKNKKCHSLSTTSSPTKYEKILQIESQSIDKTIERRIIKQIMKSNMIFRSKMDFVTKVNNNAKQENNKIKNYVRKYLLNQI